ncbi:TrmH family RNA methyltransferase [Bacilli bacterium PM5-3]|nr:TrmH family RNA methyltransferase [Bacilli bacterium PM5-3]
MELISSISNQKIKEIKKLRMKKYRDKNKEFIVEGEHLVEEAINNDSLKTIITMDVDYVNSDYEVIYVSDIVMKSLSLLSSIPRLIGICQIIDSEVNLEKNLVVLDGIQDPGNLGTIIRNALAFNLNNFIFGLDCVDIYNPKVIQASQGALFQINFEYCNLKENILTLKDNNYTLIGTSLENGIELKKDTVCNNKKAYYFGNEGQGIKKEILDLMDVNYFIEINNIESLNVACASAIIFYQFQ